MKKNSIRILSFLLLAVLGLSGCGAREESPAAVTDTTVEQTERAEDKASTVEESGQEEGSEVVFERNPDQVTVDRMTLSFTVDEIPAADQTLKSLIRSHGGLIDFSDRSQAGDRWSTASYTFRIPPDQNDAFYQEIQGLGELESETLGSEDITSEYRNSEIRLQNLQAQNQRLQELLAQATDMEDILTLEEKATENIIQQEEIQAQINALKDQADYINYNVDLHEKILAAPKVEDGFIQRVINTNKGAWATFVNLIQNLILLVISLIPYLLLAGLAFVIYRQYRKRHPKKEKTSKSKQVPWDGRSPFSSKWTKKDQDEPVEPDKRDENR